MATIEKLKEDISILKTDLVDYTSQLASASVQASAELKEKLQHKIWTTKRLISDLESEIRLTAKEAAYRVDEAVREKPYHTAGLALVVGVLIGYMARKK